MRDAMRLGIDKDDTVIRRRLRSKMEFLNDAEAEAKRPATDADLSAYLAARPHKFQEPPRVAFEQVYLDAQKRGATAQADAATLLGSIKKDAALASTAGDPTQLPTSMPLTDRRGITQLFGNDFAAERLWICSRATARAHRALHRYGLYVAVFEPPPHADQLRCRGTEIRDFSSSSAFGPSTNQVTFTPQIDPGYIGTNHGEPLHLTSVLATCIDLVLILHLLPAFQSSAAQVGHEWNLA